MEPATVVNNTDPADQWRWNLTNHKPTDAGIQKMEHLRTKAKDMASSILGSTPVSREQSLALTHLETALFYANAAIARTETEDKR